MPNGGGGRGGGGVKRDGPKKGLIINEGGGEQGNGLKKGPWTESEDAILREYVMRNGEGNWNGVRRKTGLMRCGKSCRLRWANHLKPDLKKVPFSPEEEYIIMDLHSKLGNKWARMASELPGRTDNEIKNFWNTRMKRRNRAGFPKNNNDGTSQDGFALAPRQIKPLKISSFGSLVLSSSDPRTQNFNPIPVNLSTPTNSVFQIQQINPPHFYTNQIQNQSHQLKFLHPVSFFGATNPTWFDPNLSFEAAPSLIQYGQNDMSYTSMMMGAIAEPEGLPSIQIASDHPTNTLPSPPMSSKANGVDCGSDSFSYNINGYEIETTSGLLDALVQESQTKYSRKTESSSAGLGEGDKPVVVIDDENEDDDREAPNKRFKLASTGDAVQVSSGNDNGLLQQWNNMSASQSQSTIGGMERSEEMMEEMNSMAEDLMSLLSDIPTPMPLPEWYRTSSQEHNHMEGHVEEDMTCNKGL
ncbi:transcription factor MYB101-like [Tripterygium wilfordii]|uniref:transcription factor MYB101-like n=1 Tax=Tripterygium wilfordii TaxID=458696 RepID=UPI0018F820FF|nr:transcription factor MYB101-like [Tripterygium wilfordii]